MWKKSIVIAVLLIGTFVVFNQELISYGYMQAKGQVKVLWDVQPVEQLLNDPDFPDSLKAQIRLIQEIKQFGYDSLGLQHSDNYTTFYDQKGKPILWNITASPKYALEAYEWHFPILGTFPYKGFFDSTRAVSEIKLLHAQGYDTDLGEVAAWSTLGYAKDPILSGMLSRSVGSLANLVLHEITHGTLFVKNNMELNENVATFVGDIGAQKFLMAKYGVDSKEFRQYEYGKRYRDAYATHLLRGAKQLDSLYSTYTNQLSESVKDSLKWHLIEHIMTSADTLLNHSVGEYRKGKPFTELPNNAFFTGFKTYKVKQSVFKEEFEKDFNGDFQRYMAYLKEKYPPRRFKYLPL